MGTGQERGWGDDELRAAGLTEQRQKGGSFFKCSRFGALLPSPAVCRLRVVFLLFLFSSPGHSRKGAC
jgi:hypothetical protein